MLGAGVVEAKREREKERYSSACSQEGRGGVGEAGGGVRRTTPSCCYSFLAK